MFIPFAGEGVCIIYASVFQTLLSQGTFFSLKKLRGTPPAEIVIKSVGYIDSIKLFSSKCQ